MTCDTAEDAAAEAAITELTQITAQVCDRLIYGVCVFVHISHHTNASHLSVSCLLHLGTNEPTVKLPVCLLGRWKTSQNESQC